MSKIVAPVHSLSDKKEEILIAAARLFSQNGYAAVSMRALATETDITPAALYHHFSDKMALYYAVLRFVFTDKASAIVKITKSNFSPEAKLETLILWLIKLFSTDAVFAKLLHRELLDGDKSRIALLTKEVIEPPFVEIKKLIKTLVPNADPTVLAISATSLILGYFQLLPILQNLVPGLPDGRKMDKKSTLALADSVKSLLLGQAQSPQSPQGLTQ